MDATLEGHSREWERKCVGCGYLLRGLPSNRCPECGRSFEPERAFVLRLMRLLRPVELPARRARKFMIFLIVFQVLFLPPLVLSIPIWICMYYTVMHPYWRLVLDRRRTLKEFGVSRSIAKVEPGMVWRTRAWLASGLLLTIFQIPQWAILAVEFPYINYRVHEIYEKEPLLEPNHWHWCLLHPVSNVIVSPNGVSFDLATKPLGYFIQPPLYPEGPWYNFSGQWWVSDRPDFDFANTFFPHLN